ncbi:Lipase_3 domain-containing protein, partial [Cephalotus follicularis]
MVTGTEFNQSSGVAQGMGQRRWLTFAIFMLMCYSCYGRDLQVKHEHNHAVYNHTLATILVEYASAVYMSDLTELFTWTCPRCDGLTKGFEIIDILVDIQHCLQAFVGVARDLNAVVIAFRGTQENSIQNWVEDLFWKQLDLNYPGMPDAMVHHGFYGAYHNTTIRPGILDAVGKAKEYYGDLDILLTGHSMGGAMASFCGLDLTVNHKAKNVQVLTFGQPRIGNAAFASYYSKLVPQTIRVTNEHDMVPHLPPYYSRFP